MSDLDPDAKALADELQWIQENPERCKKCGHLAIFHHEHDSIGDEVCAVGDCKCGFEPNHINCPKCGKQMSEMPNFKGLWICPDYEHPVNDAAPFKFKCNGTNLTEAGARLLENEIMLQISEKG